ncbi:MAG TPA: DNA-directed RNA polymerase subunit alpha [Campylobacterales bacterium]|nr:DNA-directed RNA polymerase subunit alpha [Campylobacterales bacterium]
MKKIKVSPLIPSSIEVESENRNSAKISIFPFETGYAITIAHPLKRLLLSASVGCAPTAVKIDGVTHEFDYVRGMLEDVTEFILNLKNIRFQIKSDAKRVVANYSFSGHREIKGFDLDNDEVDIVTKDLHLATINDDAVLNFSVIIERGMGFVASEELRALTDTNYIPLDAYFMPVRKAVYDIENILVEDNPNYEKLVLSLETDGQVDAETVFKEAVKTLYDQLSIFNKELSISSTTTATVKNENDGELKKLLISIDDLNLSARSHNCLTRGYVKYLGDLVLMSEKELSEVRNLGKKSLDEIKEKMDEMGYPVGTELPEELLSALKAKLAQLKDR